MRICKYMYICKLIKCLPNITYFKDISKGF